MFLAMKYEEIYPPRLKSLFPFVKVDLSLREYRTYEAAVLARLGASLDLKTANDILEEQLGDSPAEAYFTAYYFLEMVYSGDILETFSVETVCKSILYLMQPMGEHDKRKEFRGISMTDIIMCSKRLIQARTYQIQQDATLSRKYSHNRYLKVA